MSIPRLFTGLLLLGGLLLGGCAAPSPIAATTVSLISLKPGGDSLQDGHLVASLRIINRNIVPVGFIKTTHKLYLGGEYVGEIFNTKPVGVASANYSDFEAPLTIEDMAQLRTVLRQHSGTVPYRMESDLRFQNGDELMKLGVDSSGQVDVTALNAVR